MDDAQTLSHQLLELGADCLVRLPVVVVWLAGMLVAALLWRRNPRGALLLLLAMTGLLVVTLVLTGVYWVLYTLAQQGDSPLADGVDFWLRAGGFVEYAANAAAWILVLIAVFPRRPEPRPALRPPDVVAADPPPAGAYRERRPFP
jgi:hypothetical protein